MTGAEERDRGLRTVHLVTRWVAGLGVVVSGIVAGLVAHAQPGRAATLTSSTASAGAPPTTAPLPNLDGGGAATDPGLQAPSAPPVPAYNPPVVQSGSS